VCHSNRDLTGQLHAAARKHLRSGAGQIAEVDSVGDADLVARPNGSLGQHGAVDASLAFMFASQQPHDLGIRPCDLGIDRDHLLTGVAADH
jgi:hypothetical protein